MYRKIAMMLLVGMFGLGFAIGCEEESAFEQQTEEIGENMEEAGENARENMEEAGEEMEEGAEDMTN